MVATISSATYQPAPVPADPKLLQVYLTQELQKLSRAIGLLAQGHVDMTYAAPAKPRVGDIRLADGTKWNPGSGEGLYVYRTGGWQKLG